MRALYLPTYLPTYIRRTTFSYIPHYYYTSITHHFLSFYFVFQTFSRKINGALGHSSGAR